MGPAGATSLASWMGLADLNDFVPVASRAEAAGEGEAEEGEVFLRSDAAAASAEVVPPLTLSPSSSFSLFAPTVTPLSTLFVLACAADSVEDSAS